MDHQEPMRILLIGNGGREHAIAWKLAASQRVNKLFVVPGNGGTASLGDKVENVGQVSASDFKSLLDFAITHNITLLLPGPEAPLVDGIVDYFYKYGPARIACFGPSKLAARLEGSKAFAKDFMHKHGIPTARSRICCDFEDGRRFLELNQDRKWVIKADGLAGGKGVIIPATHSDAIAALETVLRNDAFGAAGRQVVIEEFLEGEEISILSFSDGYTIRSLPAAQDHKRINDNDEGKNTGGMGAYAPASIATPKILAQIDENILKPTIDHMRNAGSPFIGCLFTGLMLTRQGPRVLEYNVRLGDPETQALLPLLETDLADILIACVHGTLSSVRLDLKATVFSTTVVVSADGYPDEYDTDKELKVRDQPPDTYLFHAGTRLADDNTLRTSGGRVIAATAIGLSVRDACDKAYTGVRSIQFDRMHYRTDIATRELRRCESPLQPTVLNESGLTYASAGVSIEAGNTLVDRIAASVANTKRPGADATIGGFGGVLNLADAGYGADAPRIVSAIDGIGTKLFIAQAVADYSTVGIDLVAMNVNDLVVQGAEPLQFLDYYACGKLDVEDAAQFVNGVADGCRTAGCALVGGETAEMPGLYREKYFDAAGCAVGALKQGFKLLPDRGGMKEGDVLLGLVSSGIHSNGFSLVRKILERAGLEYGDRAPWDKSRSVGEALLTPTTIYVKILLTVLERSPTAIKGMAHITGGGLVENVPRMLPKHLAARIIMNSWKRPEVFKWLKREGGLSSHEMVRTFNCGIGMVCVVSASEAGKVLEWLENAEPPCKTFRIGALEARGSKHLDCIIDGSL